MSQGTRGTLSLLARPATHTIGFWRRIAAPVTVGIRQGLLWFQPCRSGASNRSFPHRLAPPSGSLQAENTSFFPRQRICACFKVSLFYQTGLPLSSSLIQMQNEENSTFDGKFRAGFILRCTGTGQRPAEVCASPVSSIIMTLPGWDFPPGKRSRRSSSRGRRAGRGGSAGRHGGRQNCRCGAG